MTLGYSKIMKKIFLIAMGALLAPMASAKITLPRFITDNMVVQQNNILTIPGTAAPGAKVSVKVDWDGGNAITKADNTGHFTLSLPTPAAGGPFTIILSDDTGDDLVLSNVLSGEVWLCSGQSNMEMPVNGWSAIMNRDEVVATAQHPDIRLLQVRKNTSLSPMDDAEVNMGGWVMATPGTLDFSAIAYLFGLRLHDELGVPVGIIDSSWGGTSAEAWTASEWFEGVPGFDKELAGIRNVRSRNGNLDDFIENVHNDYIHENGLDRIDFDLGVMQHGDGWGVMSLPGYWEGSVLPNYDGGVWFQRKLELPASAAGKDLQLNFCAIDDYDRTFFNGVEVGHTDGSETKRSYAVPGNLVKAGENVISVLAVDFFMAGGFRGDSADMFAVVDGNRYPLAGDWSYRAMNLDRPLTRRPDVFNHNSAPGSLYNAMIHPLHVMPVKGVAWYQGCNNVGRAEQHEPLFQNLIKNWRATWNNADMPFYFVQLAAYTEPRNVQPDSQWALLRNTQAKALALPNTGMAVAIDLGNPIDIHPADKQGVANRLALIALARDYGKDYVYEAPVCVNSKVDGNKMVLKFNGAIKPTANAVTGFIIGDKDGKFACANARLDGTDTIVLTSPLISKPTVARYNWADYPDGNLYGPTGLPVAPFATDK